MNAQSFSDCGAREEDMADNHAVVQELLKKLMEFPRTLPPSHLKYIVEQLTASSSPSITEDETGNAPAEDQAASALSRPPPKQPFSVLRTPTKNDRERRDVNPGRGDVPDLSHLCLGPDFSRRQVPVAGRSEQPPSAVVARLNQRRRELLSPLFDSSPPPGLSVPGTGRSAVFSSSMSPGAWDASDEYRDDQDPGYRLRDLPESELMREIVARDHGEKWALQIPYSPAFPLEETALGNGLNSTTTGSHIPCTFLSEVTQTVSGTDSAQRSITPEHRSSRASSLADVVAQTLLERRTEKEKSNSSAHPAAMDSCPPWERSVTGDDELFSAVTAEDNLFGSAIYSADSVDGTQEGRAQSPAFGEQKAEDTISDVGSQESTYIPRPTTGPDDGLLVLHPTVSSDEDRTGLMSLRSPQFGNSSTRAKRDEAAGKGDRITSPQARMAKMVATVMKTESSGKPEKRVSAVSLPQGTSSTTQRQVLPRSRSAPRGMSEGADVRNAAPCKPSTSAFRSVDSIFLLNMSPSIDEKVIVQKTENPYSLVHEEPLPAPARPMSPPPAEPVVPGGGETYLESYGDGDPKVHRQRQLLRRQRLESLLVYPTDEPPLKTGTDVVYDCMHMKVYYERGRTGFEELKELCTDTDTVVAGRYRCMFTLGQAAFSKAVCCYDMIEKKQVCLKVIRNDKDFIDQSLDEVKLMRFLAANVSDLDQVYCLKLLNFFYYREHLILVTELLMENLYDLGKRTAETHGESFYTMGRLQKIAYQVVVAMSYLHSLRLVHCDLKPENVLISDPATCAVKVIDFGSSCFEDDQLSSYVQSRSYRAPEVLLGLPYDNKVDMWSLGCILAELWTGYVLFQNTNVASLLARILGIVGQMPYYMICRGEHVKYHFTRDGQIFNVLPPPDGVDSTGERIVRVLLPKKSSLRQRMRTDDGLFLDFLTSLLTIDPCKRLSSRQALEHPWLQPGHYPDGL